MYQKTKKAAAFGKSAVALIDELRTELASTVRLVLRFFVLRRLLLFRLVLRRRSFRWRRVLMFGRRRRLGFFVGGRTLVSIFVIGARGWDRSRLGRWWWRWRGTFGRSYDWLFRRSRRGLLLNIRFGLRVRRSCSNLIGRTFRRRRIAVVHWLTVRRWIGSSGRLIGPGWRFRVWTRGRLIGGARSRRWLIWFWRYGGSGTRCGLVAFWCDAGADYTRSDARCNSRASRSRWRRDSRHDRLLRKGHWRLGGLRRDSSCRRNVAGARRCERSSLNDVNGLQLLGSDVDAGSRDGPGTDKRFLRNGGNGGRVIRIGVIDAVHGDVVDHGCGVIGVVNVGDLRDVDDARVGHVDIRNVRLADVVRGKIYVARS